MQLRPAMPVFKYEGKETSWSYSEVPHVEDRDPDPLSTVPGATKAGNVKEMDPTSIRGTAKPGKSRTVLGRTVETIEVRQEVQLGVGKLAQTIVETSVYGRGIGLIESLRKSTLDGKKQEIRTKLVAHRGSERGRLGFLHALLRAVGVGCSRADAGRVAFTVIHGLCRRLSRRHESIRRLRGGRGIERWP